MVGVARVTPISPIHIYTLDCIQTNTSQSQAVSVSVSVLPLPLPLPLPLGQRTLTADVER